MSTFDIGTLDEYDEGVPRQLNVDGHVLVAVRVADVLYVLNDQCSHEDFSLSEGEVDLENAEIECARHGAMFRLSDGEPTSFPATRPVAHYEVTSTNGRLGVTLP